MTATVAEQIMARIAAVLTNTTVAGNRVERARAAAIGLDECPAIGIRRLGSDHQPASFENDKITTAFAIDCFVAGTTPTSVETAADALHQAAHALLLADATLADLGRATLRCTATEGDPEIIERAVYRLTATYQIDAWVLRADLATPA